MMGRATPAVAAEWAGSLPQRHVCRAPYVPGLSLTAPTATALHSACTATLAPPTVPLGDGTAAAPPRLHLVDVPSLSTAARDGVTGLVKRAAEAQSGDAAYRAELLKWLRFSRAEAAASGDGLWLPTVGAPEMPRWLGQWVVPAATWWSGPAADCPLLTSSSAWAVITTDGDSVHEWVDAGRAALRLTVAATHAGLSHAYHSQVLEVPHTRAELRDWLAATGGGGGVGGGGGAPQLFVRVGTSTVAQWPTSFRRPLDSVVAGTVE